MKLKILDLYCGAGGCSMGYYKAGFEVEGVDINPQPNYPFSFHQMDALEFLETYDISRFSAIHASPPCQAFSRLKSLNPEKKYPDLLKPTRKRLIKTGLPYVIENVQGAPLQNPIMLCGTMFGLKVFRHRLFESNMFLLQPEHFKHDGTTGAHRWPYKPVNGYVQVTGTGNFKLKEGQQAMGIDWMKKKELAQAIPPAYTEFIGRQLIDYIKSSVAL